MLWEFGSQKSRQDLNVRNKIHKRRKDFLVMPDFTIQPKHHLLGKSKEKLGHQFYGLTQQEISKLKVLKAEARKVVAARPASISSHENQFVL